MYGKRDVSCVQRIVSHPPQVVQEMVGLYGGVEQVLDGLLPALSDMSPSNVALQVKISSFRQR